VSHFWDIYWWLSVEISTIMVWWWLVWKCHWQWNISHVSYGGLHFIIWVNILSIQWDFLFFKPTVIYCSLVSWKETEWVLRSFSVGITICSKMFNLFIFSVVLTMHWNTCLPEFVPAVSTSLCFQTTFSHVNEPSPLSFLISHILFETKCIIL